MRIDIIPNHVFAYSNEHSKYVKPDGSDISADELFKSIANIDWVNGTGPDIEMVEVKLPTTYTIKSSPNSNLDDSCYITEENLATYAAMLNGLMAKFNIESNFKVKFCSMDGWMVCSDISSEDMSIIKLRALDLSECEEDVSEFLNDLYEFNEEEVEE